MKISSVFAICTVGVLAADPPTHDTECSIRALLYEYALKLQPERAPMVEVFDSLELLTMCGKPRPTPKAVPPPSFPLPAGAFFVDAVTGSDGAAGTEAAPFKTVNFAIAATRHDAVPKAVVLRAGTHFLSKGLDISAQDENLLLTNYPGEEAWLSGGVLLDTKWEKAAPFTAGDTDVGHSCEDKCVAAGHCCVGDSSSFQHPSCAMGCTIAKVKKTVEECTATCHAADNKCTYNGIPGHSFGMCASCPTGCDASDGVAECVAGCRFELNATNIYVTDVGDAIDDFTGLMTLESHRRLTRARFPNAVPEDRASVQNLGGKDGLLKYIAPKVKPAAEQVWIDLTTGPHIYNYSTLPFYNGYANGRCKTAGDPNCPCGSWKDVRDGKWESASYHCAKNISGGWENMDQGDGYYNGPVLPLGFSYNTTGGLIKNHVNKWSNPVGGIVVAWRAQGWYVNMYNISSVDKEAGMIHWVDSDGMPQGGWQGGRGWQVNGSNGDIDPTPPFYVENILEELDAPDEWFFDRAARKLYLFHNGTGSPTGGFVATSLKEMIGIRGSKDKPVKNITIRGLGFRDAAATFMEPWGVPSGGDWALYRGASVLVEGAENVTIEGNFFKRVDGNGIILSGYTRHVQMVGNEFFMTGDSAMAGWGYTDENDGTGGEQPRQTLISKNFAHELGVFQLQSSMWFQAKTAQTTIEDNLFFNGPRAGINFNDGFGGGNVVARNGIWNQCRQSGDHGPINSWDRQIFLTDVKNGIASPSYEPALTEVHHNFIIANYGGSQGFDNDDGSSWYSIHHNFIYGEGLKQDYGGHDSSYVANLNVVHHYDGQNCFNTWTFVPGHQHVFENNTCIMLFQANYGDFQGACELCKGMGPSGRCMPDLANNAYYSPNGTSALMCGSKLTPLADVQKLGTELGSTTGVKPSDDAIISQARELLGMSQMQVFI